MCYAFDRVDYLMLNVVMVLEKVRKMVRGGDLIFIYLIFLGF